MERDVTISGQTEPLIFKPNPATALGAEIGISILGVVGSTCIHYFIINRLLNSQRNFLLSLAIGAGVGAIYFYTAWRKLKARGSKSLVIKTNEVVVEDRMTKDTFLIADVIKAKLAHEHTLQWEFYVRYRAEPVILPLQAFLTEEMRAIQAAVVQRMPAEKELTFKRWEPLN